MSIKKCQTIQTVVVPIYYYMDFEYECKMYYEKSSRSQKKSFLEELQ